MLAFTPLNNILKIWLFFCSENPSHTIKIKLIYVGVDGAKPNSKSEKSIILIGSKKAIFLFFRNVPENKATAYTAVKLSRCGIILVVIPINIKIAINTFCLFSILLVFQFFQIY